MSSTPPFVENSTPVTRLRGRFGRFFQIRRVRFTIGVLKRQRQCAGRIGLRLRREPRPHNGGVDGHLAHLETGGLKWRGQHGCSRQQENKNRFYGTQAAQFTAAKWKGKTSLNTDGQDMQDSFFWFILNIVNICV
jgi:hypothetical protein